jgi:hypothetical protein
MCAKVGDQLKTGFNKGQYSKVDFNHIEISTKI